MSLVAPTQHLQDALASIHQASLDFTNPDPQVRAKGEATFLALRQSQGALEYACFALEHSQDPLVLFQSLNTILFVLPSLPLDSPTQDIHHLILLRDFLLHFCVSRSEQAARSAPLPTDHSTSWPQYVRSRALQTAMAVEKRLLGLQLAQHVGEATADSSSLEQVVQSHVVLLNSQLSSLLTFPTTWPTDPIESAVTLARITAGLGLVRAVVDEFILTSANDTTDTAQSDRDRRSSSLAASKTAAPGTPVGLNLLQHRQCKSLIQNHVLAGLMTAVFQLLHLTISIDHNPTPSIWRFTLFSQAASTTEKLLGWTFTSFDPFTALAWQQHSDSTSDDTAFAIGISDEDDFESPSTAPFSASGSKTSFRARSVPDPFVAVLLSDDVVSLLSAAYRFGMASLSSQPTSRDLSFSVHRLRQCFLSACSFAPQIDKPQHVPILLQRTKHLCATLRSLVDEQCSSSSPLLSAKGNSMLFLAQAYQILVSVTPIQILATALQSSDGAEGSSAFVSSLSTLGKAIYALAFHRPKDTDEEDDLAVLTEDTVDTLLGCWQSLTATLRQHKAGQQPDQHVDVLARAIYGSIRDQVFGPYVTGRLEAAAVISQADEPSELGEATGKDREVFSDQLITIASLGRTSPAENLRALQQLAQPLCEKLSAKAQGHLSLNDDELGQLWEQIHWLILIAGHLLADDHKGETPEVPHEIASSSEPDDPAVALIMLLGLHLLQHLSTHGAASMQASSPQVTETLLWFTGRWTSTYLLIDERSGFATNPSIQRIFGGEAGRQVLTFLLQRLSEKLQLWMSDSDVLTQLAHVLTAFTRSSGIMIYLLQLPEMEHLVSAIVSGLDRLPANTHGVLVSCVVSCIYSGANHTSDHSANSAESYFKQITASIEHRFGSVLSRPDFGAIAQRSDVISAVQTSLDMLEGLASSIQPNSAEIVYGFISKFFPAFSQLCRAYDTRPEIAVSVLRVIHTLCVSLELDFGVEPFIVMGLNEALFELIQALQGESRAGKKKTHLLLASEAGSPLEDEEPYEGLCLLTEILCELSGSSKAGVDDGGDDHRAELQPSKTSDICLYGFDHIMTLLDPEPLSVPRVRSGFGRLTSLMFAQFSGRMILLSTSTAHSTQSATALTATSTLSHLQKESNPTISLQKSVQALSVCIKMDEVETAQMGLESILAFTKTVSAHFIDPHSEHCNAHPQLVSAIQSCLSTTMALLLLEPLDSSLFYSGLFALHSLAQVARPVTPDFHSLSNVAATTIESPGAKESFLRSSDQLLSSALDQRTAQNVGKWAHETKPTLLRWRANVRTR